MIDASGLRVGIEVDGGIGTETVAGAVTAGANLLVAGSALFRDPEGLAHAVSDLRARGVAAQQALSLRPAPRPLHTRPSQVGEVAFEAPGRPAKRNAHRSTSRPSERRTATAYAAACSR